MNQRKWITREEIAEIYDQLGFIEMRIAQLKIQEDPEVDSSVLDRSFSFYEMADQVRENDTIKPLVREKGYLIRSGRNNW